MLFRQKFFSFFLQLDLSSSQHLFHILGSLCCFLLLWKSKDSRWKTLDKGCSTAAQQSQLCIQEENSPDLKMMKTMIVTVKMMTIFTMTMKIRTIFTMTMKMTMMTITTSSSWRQHGKQQAWQRRGRFKWITFFLKLKKGRNQQFNVKLKEIFSTDTHPPKTILFVFLSFFRNFSLIR